MRRLHLALTAVLSVSWVAAIANGCAASSAPLNTGGQGTTGSKTGSGGTTSSHTTTTDTGIGGGLVVADGGDASDAPTEGSVNPCGSKCGPAEICDPAHTGFDDNCNGTVDEGCSCTPGSVHWCFKGDPSYRNSPGCFDGSMTCSELGLWSECVGGVHATDHCYANNPDCHPISSLPGQIVDLKTGTGAFSGNAVPGSETYTVTCPVGVSQCPGVHPPDQFTAVQSGEYSVIYTKQVAGDPNPKACTYSLFVGARGLRVELSWEHHTTDNGVDLDLHVHQPVNTQPWSIMGAPQDCTWSNCNADYINGATAPNWFPSANKAPDPCNWDVETSPASLNNTCYNDPGGAGAKWRAMDMGCHNPRSDIDTVQCDYSITDSNDLNWCGPENVNVDYPPLEQWFRVGVHYYRGYGYGYDVHPEVKIFCNGALSADLGPHSYYMPEAPITFEPADGLGTGAGNRFWIAGDVAFTKDACGNVSCVVKPIYSDATSKTPLFTIDNAAITTFAPPWPPPP